MDSPSAFTNIIQGGSFAVIATLLLWAAWNIPAWMKEWKEEREAERVDREKDRKAREQERDGYIANFRADREMDRNAASASMKYLMEVFKEDQKEERETCERRHSEIMAAVRDNRDTIERTQKETRHGLANVCSAIGLKQLAEEWKKKAEEGEPP